MRVSMPFDPAAVRELANILADTGLTEIEIESEAGRIRVVRSPAPVMAAPAMTVPVAAAPMAAAPVAAAATVVIDDPAKHPGVITSPMVGVAYLSAEPGSAPFVNVGQSISAGQTVMLIEAMKTFNQIKATKSGTLTRILIAAGQPVEYGEPLMIVE
jgi:acetyl-CoA carboxylase biotin carboxyl carrier protein